MSYYNFSGKFTSEVCSIIIPTYNRAEIICETLDSVWDQSYRPIEMVIVDDGSSDITPEIVEEWIAEHSHDSDFSTTYLYQQNSGVSTARNLGLKVSTGEYIQFLDSDDLLLPEKITDAVSVLSTDENVDFVYCLRGDFIDGQPAAPWEKIHADLEFYPSVAEIVLNAVSTPLPLFRRRLLVQTGFWCESLSSMDDWEYISRATFYANQVKKIDKIQVHCRQHENERLSVKSWGNSRSIQSHAVAYMLVYRLLKDSGETMVKHYAALNNLAFRSLSCIRVSTASGDTTLARNILAQNRDLLNENVRVKREAAFWRVLLKFPAWMVSLIFLPVRLRRAGLSRSG